MYLSMLIEVAKELTEAIDNGCKMSFSELNEGLSNYSLGVSETEKDAIETLKHDENCSYNASYELAKTQPEMINYLNYTYLRIFEPLPKQ